MGDILTQEEIDNLLRATDNSSCVEEITIELDNTELLALALEAHRHDVTLNDYIVLLLRTKIEESRSDK